MANDQFDGMCIYVSFHPLKRPLFNCRLILPVGTESILTNPTKSNYRTHTNGAETIWYRTGVGPMFDDDLESA